MIRHLPFSVWLTSLSMIISKSTHVAANGIILNLRRKEDIYTYSLIPTLQIRKRRLRKVKKLS